MSRPATLRLAAAALAQLDAWRVDAGAEEACGLLVGQRRGSTLEVGSVARVPNLALDRRATFLVDPGAQVAAEDAARRDGLEVLGAWHTHPRGTPEPSGADRDGAWSDRVTLIGGSGGAWAAWWSDRGSSAPRALRIDPAR